MFPATIDVHVWTGGQIGQSRTRRLEAINLDEILTTFLYDFEGMVLDALYACADRVDGISVSLRVKPARSGKKLAESWALISAELAQVVDIIPEVEGAVPLFDRIQE